MTIDDLLAPPVHHKYQHPGDKVREGQAEDMLSECPGVDLRRPEHRRAAPGVPEGQGHPAAGAGTIPAVGVLDEDVGVGEEGADAQSAALLLPPLRPHPHLVQYPEALRAHPSGRYPLGQTLQGKVLLGVGASLRHNVTRKDTQPTQHLLVPEGGVGPESPPQGLGGLEGAATGPLQLLPGALQPPPQLLGGLGERPPS